MKLNFKEWLFQEIAAAGGVINPLAIASAAIPVGSAQAIQNVAGKPSAAQTSQKLDPTVVKKVYDASLKLKKLLPPKNPVVSNPNNLAKGNEKNYAELITKVDPTLANNPNLVPVIQGLMAGVN